MVVHHKVRFSVTTLTEDDLNDDSMQDFDWNLMSVNYDSIGFRYYFTAVSEPA